MKEKKKQLTEDKKSTQQHKRTFNSSKSAKDFATKVNGKISNEGCKFVVSYIPTEGYNGSKDGIPHGPAIRPSGTEGPEWDDYAFSADDF